MRLLSLLLLLVLAAPSAAQVYRWKDEHGVTHYSDKPPASGSAESVAIRPYVPPSDAPQAAPSASKKKAASAARPAVARRALDVVMYSSATCGYCKRAARYFGSRGVGFREIDINASAAAKAEFGRRGGFATPLIFVNGQRVLGFDRARLDQILSQNGW
jgi:glutaredoxin